MGGIFVFDLELGGRILFGGLLLIHAPDWALLAVGPAYRGRGGSELEVILERIVTRDRQPSADDLPSRRGSRLGRDSHGDVKSFGRSEERRVGKSVDLGGRRII